MLCNSKSTQIVQEDCDSQDRQEDPAGSTCPDPAGSTSPDPADSTTPERPVAGTNEEVHINLRMYHPDDGINKWIIPEFQQASTIQVEPSEVFDIWVWERSFSNDSSEVRWSIRPSASSHLYITHNNLEDVSLEPMGENRYFIIEVGSKGYAIRVPATNKFIGHREGKLVLLETMTEWHVSFWERNVVLGGVPKPKPRQDVFEITHETRNEKWVSGILKAGDYITVATDGSTSQKSKWISTINAANYTRTFSPAEDLNLFVTCKPETNEIILETKEKADQKNRDLAYIEHDKTTVELLHFDRTKYVTARPLFADGTKLLRLTDNKKHATKWRYPLIDNKPVSK